MPLTNQELAKIRTQVAQNLAAAFLSGEWTAEGMERTGAAALDVDGALPWLQRLISEILDADDAPYPPAPDKLAGLIFESRTFRRVQHRERTKPLIERTVTASPRFAPVAPFMNLDIPRLETQQDLCDWLGLPFSKIEWFADIERYRAFATEEASRHYSTLWTPRKSGPPRPIEAPKPFLKTIQRQILRGILDRVPAHDAAHGFVKGRSCLSGAARHAGEEVVLAVDLRDFFPSIPARRVHGLFRSLGYPWGVARYLTGLCVTATPPSAIRLLPPDDRPDWFARAKLRTPHLPQGAPTSPALANLCAWRLDCRLDGLARRMDARYTRYADDMAFSGDADFARRADGFLRAVDAICRDAGFSVNPRKTRIMGKGGRQRVTGLVVNQHVNVPRAEYDALKAILHNSARHGPEIQNRNAHPDFRRHLDGRVTWVENVNPRKGHRLRLAFQEIEWG